MKILLIKLMNFIINISKNKNKKELDAPFFNIYKNMYNENKEDIWKSVKGRYFDSFREYNDRLYAVLGKEYNFDRG